MKKIFILCLITIICGCNKIKNKISIEKVGTIKIENNSNLVAGNAKIIDNKLMFTDPNMGKCYVYNADDLKMIHLFGVKGTKKDELRQPITVNFGTDGNYYVIDNMIGVKSYDRDGNFIKSYKYTAAMDCFNVGDDIFFASSSFFPKANIYNLTKNDTIFFGEKLTKYITGTRARLCYYFNDGENIYLSMINNDNLFLLGKEELKKIDYEVSVPKYLPGNYAPFIKFKNGWLRFYLSINNNQNADKEDKADPRLCYYSKDFKLLSVFYMPLDNFILPSFIACYKDFVFLHNPVSGEIYKYKVHIN